MDNRIISIKSDSLSKSLNLMTRSSTDIAKLLKKHSTFIRSARDSIQYVYTLFNSGEDIWQDQCDRGIIIMTTLSESVQKLCETLEETVSSITDITASYNEFLALLYHFNEQLRKIVALVKVFRTICRTSSKQVEKKRQEIIYKLNLFIETYDDILESVCYFSEENQPRHGLHTISETTVELPTSGGICHKECRYTLSSEKKTSSIERRREHAHLKVVREGYVEELHVPGIKLEG